MVWIHLNVSFNNYKEICRKLYSSTTPQNKPKGTYKDLIHYLKSIIDVLSPDLINRYFFLFEEVPHLFLALEVRDMRDINLIRNKINQVKKPVFFDSVDVVLNTDDGSNGESAIDFFHAGTKFAFFRITPDYKPGYYHNDEVKLTHCFCNQLFYDRQHEISFYFNCLNHRGLKVKPQDDIVIKVPKRRE